MPHMPGLIVHRGASALLSGDSIGGDPAGEPATLEDIGGGLLQYRCSSDSRLADVTARLAGKSGWAVDLLSVPVHGAPKNVYGKNAATASAEEMPARRNSSSGGGVLVGVVDTGWRPHEWLNGAVLAAPDDVEALDQDSRPGLEQEAGHGTFISGLILQQAEAAGVWVERALDSSGNGNIQEVGEAAKRLARRGVHILNLSLGTSTRLEEKSDADTNRLAYTQLMRELFEINKDLVVVAAAGNLDGGQQPGEPVWPAALPTATFPNVIAVGALDRQGNSWASWSNRAPWVDFAAPGSDLLSTYLYHRSTQQELETAEDFTGWAYWSGTSFATAVVSGVLARTMTEKACTAPAAVAALRTAARQHTDELHVPVVAATVRLDPDPDPDPAPAEQARQASAAGRP